MNQLVWRTFINPTISLLAMPSVRTTRSQRRAEVLPRRTPSEDARKQYRKEILGFPRPLDVWIATSSQGCGSNESLCHLRQGEVHCTLLKHHVRVSSINLLYRIYRDSIAIDCGA